MPFVTENEMFILKDCAHRVAEKDCNDEDCWCQLTVGATSKHGLHTGLCHTLRKLFKIEGKDRQYASCVSE